MESHDVPQANSLRKLRDVLQALELGASKPAEIERLAELTIRHVGDYLHAGRALRLCALEQSAWNLTDRGRRLLSTQRDSNAERHVWREAIRTSPTIQRLAPMLLEELRPDWRSLASRIEGESKLRPATAARRASALLSWRDQVMGRAEVEQVALPLLGVHHETPSVEQAHPVLSMFVARVQTRGFGLLRSVDVALGPFNCLIGANATGKSTFLDVVAFLADVVREGVVAAVARRANALEDLLSFKTGNAFELAVEVLTPSASPKRPSSRLRYELRVGSDESKAPTILGEALYILPNMEPSTSGLTYHVRLPLGWRKVEPLVRTPFCV